MPPTRAADVELSILVALRSLNDLCGTPVESPHEPRQSTFKPFLNLRLQG